jgi:integrase/recombinase XerC
LGRSLAGRPTRSTMKISALDWIERFSRHVVLERRVSPHTHTAYRLDLASLVVFCDQSGVEDRTALDVRQVRAFAARSYARGIAPSSIQRRLSALRTFQKFLIREGVLKYDCARDVSAPKAARPLPQILNVEEMTRLIEVPKATDCLFVRDRAIMELFYSSGLRLAELIGLNVRDLDLRDRTVLVLGKGSRERIVPVGRMAVTALRHYLTERKRQKISEIALFVGRRGKRLTGRAVQIRVALWARRAGIQQHVNPHLFRHSCATHLLESSNGIREVQEFLGHASISTTAIYTHLDFKHLAKVYMATHPRAKLVEATEPVVSATGSESPRRVHHFHYDEELRSIHE